MLLPLCARRSIYINSFHHYNHYAGGHGCILQRAPQHTDDIIHVLGDTGSKSWREWARALPNLWPSF